MSSKPCPRCGKNAIVTGRGAMCPVDQYFQPIGIRWMGHLLRRFGQSTDVRMPEPYRACLDCGLVWNELRPAKLNKLREILEREQLIVGGKEKGPEFDW